LQSPKVVKRPGLGTHLHAERVAHVGDFPILSSRARPRRFRRHNASVSGRSESIGDKERVSPDLLDLIVGQVGRVALRDRSGDKSLINILGQQERLTVVGLMDPGVKKIALLVVGAVEHLFEYLQRHFDEPGLGFVKQEVPKLGHGVDRVVRGVRCHQDVRVQEVQHG
jgi:hypothetical protein